MYSDKSGPHISEAQSVGITISRNRVLEQDYAIENPVMCAQGKKFVFFEFLSPPTEYKNLSNYKHLM